MRIGILTYHSVCNFGANLQALSTVCYLRNKGYEPLVIDWMPRDLETVLSKGVSEVQAEAHRAFVSNNLPVTRRCESAEDIAAVVASEGIEGIIVGSDAVLKHRPVLGSITFPARTGIAIMRVGQDSKYPNPFWGGFLQLSQRHVPSVLMSASCQNAQYRLIGPTTCRHMARDLMRFAYVSVRDRWTGDMISYLTKRLLKPAVTPDPVFGFNANVRMQPSRAELLRRFGLRGEYVLLSYHNQAVSAKWLEKFEALAASRGLECVAMAMPRGVRFSHQLGRSIGVPLDPLDWYGLIRYSKGYIGHNMHPIVVALHNGVPFFSFDNYGIARLRVFTNERSSKIFDLLELAGFSKQRCSVVGKMARVPSPECVLQKLESFERAKCLEFSRVQQNRYVEMMERILTVLAEKRGQEVSARP